MKKSIEKTNVQEIFELNEAQKGMLYHHLKHTEESLYNVQLVFGIEGDFDREKFKNAIDIVQTRHDVLRSVFRWEQVNNPVQIILKKGEIDISFADRSLNRNNDSNALDDILLSDQRERFDLEETPIRINIVQTTPNKIILVITHHHILYDGWSTGIFLKDVFEAYGLRGNVENRTLPIAPNFGEVLKAMAKHGSNVNIDYWSQYLLDFETITLFDKKKLSIGDSRGVKFEKLSISHLDLDSFVSKYKITKAALMYSAYGVLLQRYLDTSDVIFGTAVSSRQPNIHGSDQIMGNFINTIPLRCTTGQNESLVDIAKGINTDLVGRSQYTGTSYAQIKRLVGVKPEESLFDSIVVIENYPLDEEAIMVNQGFEINLISTHENTEIPLVVTIYLGDKPEVVFSYRSELISDVFIGQFKNHFELILKKIVGNPSLELAGLNMMSVEEQNLLLNGFNETALEYPREKTIDQLFEEQVERTPLDVALVFDGQELTYKELNEESNGLANVLKSKGVGPGHVVALYCNRSLEMFVNIMAVLKAGASYLPLDPTHPIERLVYMLEDSKSKVVLTSPGLSGATFDVPQTLYSHCYSIEEKAPCINNPKKEHHSENLAYVIYTSGSTGKPKGVSISHRAAHNYIVALADQINIEGCTSILSVTTFSFDIFVTESLFPLTRGLKVVLATEQQQQDPDLLCKLLSSTKVDLMQTTPSRYKLLTIDSVLFEKSVQNIKTLLVGGEAFPDELLLKLKKYTKAEIINLYGPTETTVWSTIKNLTNDKKVTIGKPIANTQVYVLGKESQLQPIGVVGELFIGGDGLASGYWGNPELTDQKFVSNPFRSNDKIYRTGDAVRWNNDGNIEYIGRLDFQLKVRGHRIELGEIESKLMSFPSIETCVVTANPDDNGDNFLAAYFTAPDELKISDLEDLLRTTLPEYMVPEHFIQLEQLPYTANGKLDRKSLPRPHLILREEYVAPNTSTEQELAKVWADLLNIENQKVSISSNFFSLGGHSLNAGQLVNKIHKVFEIRLPLNDVFLYPTLDKMAVHLDGHQNDAHIKIGKSTSRAHYPLSPAQKRLYFLHTLDSSSTAYNMSKVFRLNGIVNVEKIEQSFCALIARHDSLRTTFYEQEGISVQKVSQDFDFELERFSNSQTIDEAIRAFVRPFNLSEGLLFRASIVSVSHQEHYLLVDMHHIISDGRSIEVLLQDFLKIYSDEELANLELQYQDYIIWHHELPETVLKKQQEFWMEEFNNLPDGLDLPLDKKRETIRKGKGSVLKSIISPEQTLLLEQLTKSEGVTPFMLLLSVFNVLLSKITNQEDVVIGIPVANRPHADLDNVIGIFVNTLAVRSEVKGNTSFKDFLGKVKSKTLECLNHQSYPYEQLVDDLQLTREANRNALFDSMFVYENEGDHQLKIPGLSIDVYESEQHISKMDLSLIVSNESDSYSLSFEYDVDLFSAATVQRFSSYFHQVIAAILENKEVKISEIDMLPQEEKIKLLKEFNQTAVARSSDESFLSLFNKQVHDRPGKTALIFGTEELSYKELDDQSSILASVIYRQFPEEKKRIGLLFSPSANMVVSILSVIKSGHSFVPLSVDAPTHRNKLILEDAEVVLLLVDGKLNENDFDGLLNTQNTLFIDEIAGFDVEDQVQDFGVENALDTIYTIYTSGTTGIPKGVPVSHASLYNYSAWNANYHSLTSDDVALQLVPYYFDGFGANFYAPLMTGGTVVLVSDQNKMDSFYLLNAIKKFKVSHFALLPGLYGALLDQLENSESLSDLRIVVLAGERASEKLIEQSEKCLPHISLQNEYGPTEATIAVTHLDHLNKESNGVIGKPIDNTEIFILGKYNELLPLGVIGELCVSGVGLSTGYINNDSLTADKFISHPLASDGKVYKTGDLAKWKEDGEIQLLGRVDNQIKIRGHRIELGEIEQILNDDNRIKEAFVLPYDKSGDLNLVAYFIEKESVEFDQLSESLNDRLPGYMIPTAWVKLEAFPYTLNGKLDKLALPKPEFSSSKAYKAPQSEEEKQLATVWGDVLGIEKVGVLDNYFLLGGDSIKSIQICSRIRAVGYQMVVSDIFRYQNIQSLAPILTELNHISDQSLVSGSFDLTPIQLWFFNNIPSDQHHFNQSTLLNFKGGLSIDQASMLYDVLQEHHDGLRATFAFHENKIEQFIPAESHEFLIEEIDLKESSKAEEEIYRKSTELQASLDLNQGPLMKFCLFQMNSGSRLLMIIHHLVVDGLSWRILLEDVDSLVNQMKKGESASLPLKTDSIQNWSLDLQDYAKSELFLKLETYWQEQLNLSVDHASRLSEIEEFEGANVGTVSFELSEKGTTKLLTEANIAFGTNSDEILIIALLISLVDKFENRNIKLDLEGHGREYIKNGTNVSRTVGWFTSIFPVLFDLKHTELDQTIKYIKETLRQIPNKGMDYLVHKYLSPNASKEQSALSEHSDILFNYLGQFDFGNQENTFTIADEKIGDNTPPNGKRIYDLDFLSMVDQGRLKMNLTFDLKKYKKEELEGFMQGYQERLIEVLETCCKTEKVFTPSDFPNSDLTIDQLDVIQNEYQIDQIYPLSSMQEGMRFHTLLDPESSAYFQQITFSVKGDFDPENCENAWNLIVARHPALRTIFLQFESQKPVQVVLAERKIDFEFLDVQGDDSFHFGNSNLEQYLHQDRLKKFDLGKDTLLRISVLQIQPQVFQLILSHHHIIMDGWCLPLIIEEFNKIYAGLQSKDHLTLRPVRPYNDYLDWLSKIDNKASNLYWQEYLKEYECTTGFPKNVEISNSVNKESRQQYSLSLDESVTQSVQQIADRNQVTLNTLIRAVWGILLAKYNDSDDCVFGTVVSGRPAELDGIEHMIGLFINTIPVRVQLNNEMDFEQLIQSIQQNSLQGEPYHYQSLSSIQSNTGLGTELFDHILIFENYPIGDRLKKIEGCNYKVDDIQFFEKTNYDFSVSIIPGEKLKITFDFDPSVYESGFMKAALGHLEFIFRTLSENSKIDPVAIDILSFEQQQQLLFAHQGNITSGLNELTVCSLFEQQAVSNPSKRSISFEGVTWTYEELNTTSNQWAQYFSTKVGLVQGELIALRLDKDPQLVACILGLLKIGVAYVPIDPVYPDQRVQDIIADAQISYLVTNQRHKDSLSTSKLNVLILEDVLSSLKTSGVKTPEFRPTIQTIAYIIYTSGSTGSPKGVAVSHGSLCNYSSWAAETYIKNDLASFALYSSISFDLTVTSIFTPLISGHEIVIYDKSKNGLLIEDVLRDNQSTIIKLTPSHLNAIKELPNLQVGPDSKLECLIVGGEQFETSLAQEIHDLFHGKISIFNEYGPTEATVGCMIHQFSDTDDYHAVPIGYPIQNSNIYLLDRNRIPVPNGVSGEIYISGTCLAKGYWNNQELTNDMFVPDPFVQGQVMYQTGDIALREASGSMIYKGRIDSQIKFNGHRIELSDIEHSLKSHKAMRSVVVQFLESSARKSIICHYVSDITLDNSELRQHLMSRIPHYMIPSHFIPVDFIPLTSNGKIDKEKLPKVSFNHDDHFESPSNEVEEKLVSIWSAILEIESDLISVNRSFFELGGHSLTATAMTNKLHATFNIEISLKKVFNLNTIKELADYIGNEQWLNGTANETSPHEDEFILD